MSKLKSIPLDLKYKLNKQQTTLLKMNYQFLYRDLKLVKMLCRDWSQPNLIYMQQMLLRLLRSISIELIMPKCLDSLLI
jgi:hypothetical protein